MKKIKIENIRVYIAAPFFNEEQLRIVKEIEGALDIAGIMFHSPRLSGIVSKIEEDDVYKEEKMRRIYSRNLAEMEHANFMIAVIDNNDVGTMFELGFFTKLMLGSLRNINYRKSRMIATMSDKGFQCNLMLKFGVDCHFDSMNSFHEFAERIILNFGIDDILIANNKNSIEVKE